MPFFQTIKSSVKGILSKKEKPKQVTFVSLDPHADKSEFKKRCGDIVTIFDSLLNLFSEKKYEDMRDSAQNLRKVATEMQGYAESGSPWGDLQTEIERLAVLCEMFQDDDTTEFKYARKTLRQLNRIWFQMKLVGLPVNEIRQKIDKFQSLD